MLPITVLNDLSTEQQRAEIWQYCMTDNWQFGHGSFDDRGANNIDFWKMEMDDVASVDQFWLSVKPKCDELASGDLTVIRQYANGHTYGQGGQPHLDDQRSGCYTLLYYPMPVWKDAWDGETVFYKDDGEVRCAIKPKPNRAILFDSRILHAGRAPHRSFGGLRVTVAYKLQLR